MAIVLGGIAWAARENASISQIAQLTVDQFRARMLMPLLGASGAVTAVVMLFVFLIPNKNRIVVHGDSCPRVGIRGNFDR